MGMESFVDSNPIPPQEDESVLENQDETKEKMVEEREEALKWMSENLTWPASYSSPGVMNTIIKNLESADNIEALVLAAKNSEFKPFYLYINPQTPVKYPESLEEKIEVCKRLSMMDIPEETNQKYGVGNMLKVLASSLKKFGY